MPKRKKPRPGAPQLPRTRRARGTGTLFFDARRGMWVARAVVGRLPSGKPRYAQASAPTQAEAVELQKRLAAPGPNVTVTQWCERWLAGFTGKRSSASDYRLTVERHIAPVLGGLRISDVTSADVENTFTAWAETLGPNTIRKNAAHLHACFEAARRAKLVADNPVALARKPKAKKVDIDPFTAAELRRVVREAPPLFAVLAATGMRIGEALALDAADYDPAAGTLAVSRTYCPKHGLRSPKSENGVRVLAVPAAARPVLDAARGARSSGPLLAGRGGARQQQSNARVTWYAWLKAAGLRRRGPHQLRHSVATHLVAAGHPLADVARYLGDSVQTVVRTYLHPTGADTAAALQGVLSESPG